VAGGAGARLSHVRGAGLGRVLGDFDGVVDVTVAGRSESRAGIRVHRARLRPDEITTTQGIRVSTPARTVYDLASLVVSTDRAGQYAGQHAVQRAGQRGGRGGGRDRSSGGRDASRVVVHRDVERALAEALAQRLSTRGAMLALLDRHHGHGAGL